MRKVDNEDKIIVKHKEMRLEIDPKKKLQCCVLLNLMTHRYGRAFSDSKPINLNTIKSKLEKGLYKRTDEIAEDISVMLSDAAMCHHPNHVIHRTAIKFRGDFDLKWRSLEKKWKGEIGDVKMASDPSRKQVSEVSNREDKKKKKELVSEDEERGIKKHFLDSILASMDSLKGFGQKEKAERRKKEREGVEKIERTVWMDENLKAFEELERLCGLSLSHSKASNSKTLMFLGLVLKDI